MKTRARNFWFYSIVITAPALTVPWMFTDPAGDAVLGFPPWALWVVVTTILYSALLAWGLGRTDWGDSD